MKKKEQLGNLFEQVTKDNYADMPMDIQTNSVFLSDGTHLNEWGRYVFGNQFVDFFEKNVLKFTNK